MAEEIKEKCPLCGAEGYHKPELTEEVKEDYLISMLGSSPFSRVYDYMGGRMSVYIRSMTPELATLHKNLLRRILGVASKHKIEFTLDPTAIGFSLMVAAMVYRVDFHINQDTQDTVEVNGTAILEDLMKLDWENGTAEDIQNRIDDALNTISTKLLPGKSVPIALLQLAVGKHNILEQDLIKACADPNFIKGTGR